MLKYLLVTLVHLCELSLGSAGDLKCYRKMPLCQQACSNARKLSFFPVEK